MAEALRADIGWNKHKVKVGGPVAEGMGAAERKDRKSEGVVNGYVASHTC